MVMWLVCTLLDIPVPRLPLVWQFAWAVSIGLLGLHYLMMQEIWEFAPSYVRMEKRGLLGRRVWTEPLQAYDGVVAEELPSILDTDTDDGSVLRWRLTLRHARKRSRSVVVFSSMCEDEAHARHREYAELLGLPRLAAAVEDGGRTVFRPVLERYSAEGCTDGLWLGSFCSWAATAAWDGRTLHVRSKPARRDAEMTIMSLVFLLLPFGFVIGGYALWHTTSLLMAVAAWSFGLLALVLAVLVWVEMLSRQELIVSATDVRYLQTLFGSYILNGRKLHASDVRDVVLHKRADSRIVVRVVGDHSVIDFGYALALRTRDRQRIRDMVRMALPLASSSAAGD